MLERLPTEYFELRSLLGCFRIFAFFPLFLQGKHEDRMSWTLILIYNLDCICNLKLRMVSLGY